MRRPVKMCSAKRKAGSPDAGMGAVSTTFMAGVELVRKGKRMPVGSLTQLGTIRLGKRTEARTPLIKEFVPLAKLERSVFGGWDIFPDNAYQAAVKAGVLEFPGSARRFKKFLKSIKPMKAAFDHELREESGRARTSRRARPSTIWPLQIRRGHPQFQKEEQARPHGDGLVRLDGSFHQAGGRALNDLAKFEKAMKENIRPLRLRCSTPGRQSPRECPSPTARPT